MTEGGIAKHPKAVRAALENNGLVIMDSSGIYGNKTWIIMNSLDIKCGGHEHFDRISTRIYH